MQPIDPIQKALAGFNAQQRAIEAKKQVLNDRKTAINELTNKLSDLQASLKTLSNSESILPRKAEVTSSTPDKSVHISATTTSQATPGIYTFEVKQLATPSKLLSNTDIAHPLSQTQNVADVTIATMPTKTAITPGIFSVNGKSISIDTTDSLQSVFEKINTSTQNAVQATYHPEKDTIVLASNAPIILGTAADTSNFLTVTQLFTNPHSNSIESKNKLSTINIYNTLANANLKTPITTPGTFTINNVSFEYNPNQDSLHTLFTKINQSTANVQIKYDSNSKQVILQNSITGASAIALEDNEGSLLETLGLLTGSTLVVGTDAQCIKDNTDILTSNTNIFDASTHGIHGLSITANQIGTDTVTIDINTKAATDTIKDSLITKYNAIIDFVDARSKDTIETIKDPNNPLLTKRVVKKGLLSDSAIESMISTLRRNIFSPHNNPGTIQSVSQIGLDFTNDKLSIRHNSIFENEITKSPNDVFSFLNTFSQSLNGFLENITKKDGASTLDIRKKTIDNELRTEDNSIANIQSQITAFQEKMRQNALAQEKAMMQMNSIIPSLPQGSLIPTIRR